MNMAKKSILVGYGYWGKILRKYIQESEYFELIGIIDPHLEHFRDPETLLGQQEVTCAFVCVPIRSHYEVVMQLLDRGIHVFCEKPLCRNMAQAQSLFQKAEKNQCMLFTDYVYTASPSIRCLKSNIHMLGEVKYLHMDIRQFGRFYEDDNVYEVIGVHMVSVLVYLFDTKEREIEPFYVDTIVRNGMNQAQAGMVFFRIGKMRGKIYCSLVSGEKARRVEIICENGIMVFDMLGRDTVKIIRHKICGKGGRKRQEIKLRESFEEGNNLKAVIDDFHDTIVKRSSVNGKISLQVMEVMDRIAQLEDGTIDT